MERKRIRDIDCYKDADNFVKLFKQIRQKHNLFFFNCIVDKNGQNAYER